MFKFIAGPLGGYIAGFNYIGTVVLTVAGMMSSVFVFTFLGKVLKEQVLRRLFRNRRTFSSRNRRFVRIWRKYGTNGVAFLTPVILTPIGGTLLMTSMGTPRPKILLAMLVSAVFWSLIITAVIFFFGQEVVPVILDWTNLDLGVSQYPE
jgi:membrane protein DedA with SNARE-associated domain